MNSTRMPRHALVRYALAVLVAATVVWSAARARGIGFYLGQTKAELKLKYDVAVHDHGDGRVTVVFTLADEGRLKPLDEVQFRVPAPRPDPGGGYPADLLVSLDMVKASDDTRVGHISVRKDLAERAEIALNTHTLDGKTDPETRLHHAIPIAQYMNNTGAAPVAAPAEKSEPAAGEPPAAPPAPPAPAATPAPPTPERKAQEQAEKAESGKKDLAELQGTWALQSHEEQGTVLRPDETQFVTIAGDKITWQRNGAVIEEGTLELEATRSPKQMNYQFNSGRSDRTIYIRVGDFFIQCGRRDGKTRPSEFATGTTNGGEYLIVLKRRKQADPAAGGAVCGY